MIDIQNIRDEITNYLRSSDILAIGIRGVTTTTDNFVATAGQTAFTLDHTLVRNIRTLTVDGTSLKYMKDFIFNPSTGVVTLDTGATLDDAVVINYDYSTAGNEKIYPDFPREDLNLQSYPRVGMEITAINNNNFSLGATDQISEIMITIFAFVPVNKDSSVASGFGGTEDLSDLLTTIRDEIRENQKGFYSFPFIHPVSTNPIVKGQNNKIVHQSADFIARFIVD